MDIHLNPPRWALLIALFLGSKASAQVSTFSAGFANGGVIPDGNPAGWSDTRTLSGLSFSSIGSLKVSLSISGGTAGDLYAFLSNGSGISILLNRPGVTGSDPFGYTGSGLSIVLADGAANGDIHRYQDVASYGSLIASGGEFEPDGRAVSPYLVTDSSPRSAGLGSAFAGSTPNATWTLFVADVVTGGQQATVSQWGLEFTPAVPEPSTTCLIGALGLGAFAASRWARQRRSGGAVHRDVSGGTTDSSN